MEHELPVQALEELRALFDSVGEDQATITKRLRNVGRGLLDLASQSLSREAEIRREVIEECAILAEKIGGQPVKLSDPVVTRGGTARVIAKYIRTLGEKDD